MMPGPADGLAIKLAIFDFDGTLCSTHAAIAHAMRRTFEHFGEAPPAAAATDAVIRSGVVIAEAVTRLHDGSLSEAAVRDWVATYRRVYDGGEGLARTVMFPGVAEGLARLGEAGVTMVVLSNKGETAVRQALSHFGVAPLFAQVIGDTPGLPKKPDPAAYHDRIAPSFPAVTPRETVMVGDTSADLGFARAIGAWACWARYGFGDAECCEALRPDLVIDRFAELPDHALG